MSHVYHFLKEMPQSTTYESIARKVLELVARTVKVSGEMIVKIEFIESATNEVQMQVHCESSV